MARHRLVIPHPRLTKDAKTGFWMVSYTCPDKGYTKKRSTGERDRAKANQVMLAMAADIVGVAPKSDNYKLGELLAAYEGSKDKIADTDQRALKRLKEFFGAFTPDQLVDNAWKRYRKWRTSHEHAHASAQYQKVKKTVSDSTACRELNVMRAAISWAQRNPKWKGLAHVRVIMPGADRPARQEMLTKEDALKLVNGCAEPHQALFVLLALATAGRHRAILGLKWSQVTWPQGDAPTDHDVKFEARVGVVPRGMEMKPENVRYDIAANEGTRYMSWTKPKLAGPIHLDLGRDIGNKRKPIAVVSPSNTRLHRALVEAYERKTTDHVIEWRGRAVDRIDLSEAYIRAKLTKPSAPQHVLKHTAISWMVQDGQELFRIAQLTRTSVPTIEKVYGHLSPKHLEVVGDVLSLD
jgi:hypothetical protein